MKTNFLKSAFLMVLTAGMFSSCVKDDNYSTPELNGCTETTLVKNREVADILFSGTVAQHQNITPGVSDVIEAYVTSSDIGGNFFKSISLQTLDGSKAFSIPVDATSLFINYEPGRKVLIKMDGLYTDNPTYPAQTAAQGKRIGGLYANSSGGAEVGRLPESDFRNSVQRSCTIVNEDALLPATPVTITQVTTSDAYLNRLIEFDNVEFSSADITSTYYDLNNDLGGATNRALIDLNGNSIVFRTSAYANFAAKAVATGSGKVRGVLTKYGSGFQFMVRSEGDIKLTNPRFTPLLNEGFNSGIGAWTQYSVTGAQLWTYSSTFGNPGGMMKMSGFSTVNNANEDWLISPAQDLSFLTSATLSLDNAYKFTGNPIEIKISNNYTSGDPTAATWTTLTGATLSTGNYVYANSGALNITSFTGSGNSNVHVAIKYTSTSSAASTWEIDNVKITGN
ncbi:DUF5689 domain-containing protein [Flavobacterium sp. SUN052]|uniref:DUF5689 domain-containing protein n=1 Tax=Flavobacterium sp. SUN052 TaxID=3002441 RepID=UPI00237E0A57|nr:DUF5689 domain-containing protein [Flavobacterium sp. SUN052]MEC4004317.1 DUF5689 domain-containing protein [Flavobacterium sp. SUN052]